jgi:chemotaxis methyl-accepting protein methylase
MERLLGAARGEILRLGTAGALEAALERGDAEAEAPLVAAVTVGETYFFRQREHFDLIADLPLDTQETILAWSAGCASGEETYSMAAALRSAFKLDAPRLRVWGTDINAAALASAERAVYGRWSWRRSGGRIAAELGPSALEEGTRACVRFARHNLLDEAAFDHGAGERFDLVFCRNVLVYFSPGAAATAVERISRAMKPGAWLVLGNMDLPAAPAGMKRVGPPALCVYAKEPRPAPPGPALESARGRA